MSDMTTAEYDEMVAFVVPRMRIGKRTKREMWFRRVIGALESCGYKVVKYRPGFPGRFSVSCQSCGHRVPVDSQTMRAENEPLDAA